MKFLIPKNLLKVIEKLENKGFEVFVVGGSVRDLLLGISAKDWDLTTNAKPEELLEIFPYAKYKNEFGTVLLPEKYLISKTGITILSKVRGKTEQHSEVYSGINGARSGGFDEEICQKRNSGKKEGFYEITTYRKEGAYQDKRRPSSVVFTDKLEEDLKRRDFTINALAMRIMDVDKLLKKAKNKEFIETEAEIIDKFQGREALKNKIIRTVGSANDRIGEDALRMMRAVRFGVQLGFEIEKETMSAIKKKASNLEHISQERIRDEFEKIILSPTPTKGVELLVETGLMQWIVPELQETIEVKQNHHHYYGPYNTVYKHLLASLEKCPSEKLEVRLASFLHDIGKPKTKEGEGLTASFHNHEYAGARMSQKILERLKFPREVIDKTVLLVKNHMFYYNTDEVGAAGVRKVIRKVGLDNINDLIDVRIADRLGSGVPKAAPYKLRHFKFMVEKVSNDPISVKQLKINGSDLISDLKMQPGPQIGAILEVLLAEVIEKPELNKKDLLLKKAEKLMKKDLKETKKEAKEKIRRKNKKLEEKIKNKHRVK